MKKIKLFSLALLGSVAFMQAQDATNNSNASPANVEQLLERLQSIGTNVGSINEHFSHNELKSLRAHFSEAQNLERNSNNENQTQSNQAMTGVAETTVYGINNTTEEFLQFQANDPEGATVMGDSPTLDFESAGAVDPNNDNLAYAFDDGGNFYRVSLDTGSYDRLGTIYTPGFETWSGAEFDPVSGELYAISTDANTSTLSIIDVDNRIRTTVGETGLAAVVSLIIDDTGQGYAHDIDTDKFYAIDLATGASTEIGDLGFDANFSQGGCWVAGDPGYVYLSAFNNDLLLAQWRRVDITDGSSTVVGVYNEDDQVGWSSPKNDFLNIEDSNLEGFSFAPNPTSDILSLQSANTIDSVALYNVLGQRVLHTNVEATSKDLDLSGLAVGPYIMKVSVDGQNGTYKIMKK